MSDPDPDLARRLRSGEYVVNSDAVAAAIVARLAEVFEPGELDRFPSRPEQDHPGAGGDGS